MVRLEITIPVASQWPTQQELDARNAVEDALMDADVGEFVGAGGGMSQMDLCFEVADEKAARALTITYHLLPSAEPLMHLKQF